MAIERNGQSVTIESSRASQVTLVADGSVRTEQDQNGDTIQVRSTLSGDRLTVNSTGTSGYRDNDYQATFEPFNNGRSLRVTRQVSSEYTNRPVTVQSVYTKTSEIAQFDVNGSSTSGGYSSSSGPVSGDFIVPDNVVLMGVLNTPISTKTARENDRFTMTVRTPTEYQEARFGDIAPHGALERSVPDLFPRAGEFLAAHHGYGYTVAQGPGVSLASIHIIRSRDDRSLALEHSRPAHTNVVDYF